MTYTLCYRFGAIVLCVFLLAVSGCTGTTLPSRFYVLNSFSDMGVMPDKIEKSMPGIAIGIGPIKLPEYLDRPNIVTRAGGNELTISEFDRWAGSLKEDFTRVLAENISMLIGTDKIVIYPWRRSTLIDYQVEIDVIRFEGKLGEDAILKVRWAIFGDDDKKMLLVRTSTLQESTGGNGYDDLVAAWSKMLIRLSHEIAHEIASF